MLFQRVLVALCMVCRIVAVPEGKSILGFRVVGKAEAEKIKDEGRPIFEHDFDQYGDRQLAEGVYTSPGPRQWDGDNDVYEDEFCIIYINSDALNDLKKIWVPKEYTDGDGKVQKLWFDHEHEHVPGYIKSLRDSWDPARTIKLAWIQGEPGKVQALIPPDVIHDDELGLEAVCESSWDELPDVDKVVNYDSWDNVAGDKGDQ